MTVIESKIQLWFTVPRFDFLASLLLLTMANCSLGVGNLAPAFWRASCWTLVIVTLKLFSAKSWNASLCTIDVFFSIFASLGSCRLQLYTVIEIILTIYQYVNKIVESRDCQTYYIWGITMFDRDCKPRDYISINLQMNKQSTRVPAIWSCPANPLSCRPALAPQRRLRPQLECRCSNLGRQWMDIYV